MHYNGKAIIMYHHRTVVNPIGRVMSCHDMPCRCFMLLWVGRVNVEEQKGKKAQGKNVFCLVSRQKTPKEKWGRGQYYL